MQNIKNNYRFDLKQNTQYFNVKMNILDNIYSLKNLLDLDFNLFLVGNLAKDFVSLKGLFCNGQFVQQLENAIQTKFL